MALLANEARFFRFRVFFGACSLQNEVGDPPFFCLFGKSRSLPFCVASLKKSVRGNILGANVLNSQDCQGEYFVACEQAFSVARETRETNAHAHRDAHRGAPKLGLSLSCSNFLKKLLQFSKKVAQKLLQNSKSCSKVAPKSKSFSKVAFYFWV